MSAGLISIEQRANMRVYGWAGGLQNRAFVAGVLRRSPATPGQKIQKLLLQQTPAMEQSIPVFYESDQPLNEAAFPDGTLVSMFCRLRAVSNIDETGRIVTGIAVLELLNIRYAEAREIAPEVAEARLRKALSTLPNDASIADIKPQDIVMPDDAMMGVHPQADLERSKLSNSMLKSSNQVQFAGIIAAMEYRAPKPMTQGASSASLTVFVQQKSSPKSAIPVKLYGKEAMAAMGTLEPGRLVAIDGKILVDVKRNEDKTLRLAPFIKTFGISLAQANIHIKTIEPWMDELAQSCKTREGYMARVREVGHDMPKPELPVADISIPRADDLTVQGIVSL